MPPDVLNAIHAEPVPGGGRRAAVQLPGHRSGMCDVTVHRYTMLTGDNGTMYQYTMLTGHNVTVYRYTMLTGHLCFCKYVPAHYAHQSPALHVAMCRYTGPVHYAH